MEIKKKKKFKINVRVTLATRIYTQLIGIVLSRGCSIKPTYPTWKARKGDTEKFHWNCRHTWKKTNDTLLLQYSVGVNCEVEYCRVWSLLFCIRIHLHQVTKAFQQFCIASIQWFDGCDEFSQIVSNVCGDADEKPTGSTEKVEKLHVNGQRERCCRTLNKRYDKISGRSFPIEWIPFWNRKENRFRSFQMRWFSWFF